MQAYRLRRWPNIKLAMFKCLVLYWYNLVPKSILCKLFEKKNRSL